VADDLGRVAGGNGAGRDIAPDHTAGAYDGTAADLTSFKNQGLGADEYIVFDHDG
jgi:hypothetical protein